jgi:hypothetical protein
MAVSRAWGKDLTGSFALTFASKASVTQTAVRNDVFRTPCAGHPKRAE